VIAPPAGDCSGFTSAAGTQANVFGSSSSTGTEWTYQGYYYCSEAQALYCFEQ
jgi:hypothetical protein